MSFTRTQASRRLAHEALHFGRRVQAAKRLHRDDNVKRHAHMLQIDRRVAVCEVGVGEFLPIGQIVVPLGDVYAVETDVWEQCSQ